MAVTKIYKQLHGRISIASGPDPPEVEGVFDGKAAFTGSVWRHIQGSLLPNTEQVFSEKLYKQTNIPQLTLGNYDSD